MKACLGKRTQKHILAEPIVIMRDFYDRGYRALFADCKAHGATLREAFEDLERQLKERTNDHCSKTDSTR